MAITVRPVERNPKMGGILAKTEDALPKIKGAKGMKRKEISK
jgi:hypothetical protein